jgi:biopolymer transport protein ExbD
VPIKTLPQEEPQLNLTPMIDVILTLIIFFMVATKFSEEERAVDLKLPTAAQSGAPSAAAGTPRVVNVQADGSILLGNTPIALEELTKQLTSARQQSPKIQVLVRGDRQTPHGRMADVYGAVRQAGIPDLGIAVKIATAAKSDSSNKR